MNKQEKMFAFKVNRLRLEKEVFSLFRIEGQSIENVKKKTGLSKSTIYRYLRIFESDKPQLAAQMKKKQKTSLKKTTRRFRRKSLVYARN